MAGVPVSRRSFALLAGGGAVAGMLGGGLVAIALSGWPAENVPARRARTSFGTVELLRAGRTVRPGLESAAVHAAVSGQHAEPDTSRQSTNHTWGDVVVLELTVANHTVRPLLLSPGQLRLRAGTAGLGIAPFDSARKPGELQAGATEVMWISYLAPTDADFFSAEFSDPFLDRPLLLELPPLVFSNARGVL